MARYGTFLWGSGTLYGTQPSSELDVEPFVARAIDYRRIDVSWTPPSGTFTRFRLLRNQGNIPEHEEDGVKLIDSTDLTLISNKSLYEDGLENVGDAATALIPGGFVFYAIWLLLDDGWYAASYAYTLLAQDHSVPLGEGTDRTQTTHERFMDILPRVYTTASGNPLDEVDRDSDLWTFLSGFSYTLDELMTFADLLMPDRNALNLSPERLELRAKELGLSVEPRPSTRYQRRLVKDAQNLFSTKGTVQGVANAVEGITGYAPTLTESPNLLLSYQDGTFVRSTGLWEGNAGLTISAVDTLLPPTAEPNSVDDFYTCKAVSTRVNAFLSYGVSSPTTLGVPVKGSVSYSFSAYLQRVEATNATFAISWYNFRGTFLSTSTGTATAVGTSWAKQTHTATSPATAAFATLSITFSAIGTVYVDLCQFAPSTVTQYSEPRSLDILLDPSKTNLVVNPSFETNTSSWSIVAASNSRVINDGPIGVETGAYVLQVVGTASGTTSVTTTITARPLGVWHSCSIYARLVDANPLATLPVTMRAATSYSDATPPAEATVAYVLTPQWQRLHAVVSTCVTCSSGVVGAEGADPAVTLQVTATTTGQTIQFDAAQIETTYEPSDYFDGTYTGSGAGWSGTAHASTSQRYINKLTRLERLKDELPNFLPMNTPYRVLTTSGEEFHGVS